MYVHRLPPVEEGTEIGIPRKTPFRSRCSGLQKLLDFGAHEVPCDRT